MDHNPLKTTILLAAGGTGGHLFPAEALAAELLREGFRIIIVTDKRGHAFQTLSGDVHVTTVSAATFTGGITGKIKAALNILKGTAQSLYLLKKERPDLIIGFGGYPSFPPVLAAQLLKLPTLLHEQNGVLGKANQILAKYAQKIALSLDGTKGIENWKNKCVVTGNPVRKAILDIAPHAYTPSGTQDPFHIFITGGSQGANVFADVLPAACALLPDDLRQRLRIVHQCRAEKLTEAKQNWAEAGVQNVTIEPFFTDVAAQLKTCHLFIGRSGASTVAEIAVAGCPALFVPYPAHSDMQQKINADVISEKGGAMTILQEDFTANTTAKILQEILQSPEKQAQMAQSCKACGRPEAVKNLADCAKTLINSSFTD